jgi:hypothetical protein
LDLELIHNRLNFLANKEQNYWASEEIDEKLHMSQMWSFNQYYRLFGKNTELHDALAPFKVKHTFTTSNTPGGLINLNTNKDYLHFLSLYVQWQEGTRIRRQDAKQINEDEIGARLDSQLTPVGIHTPVITITDTGKIQLYPEVPNSGYAFYLRKPQPPKFVYRMEGRKKVYNGSNSTQMEWNESCINEIIIKALQLLGVNIDDKMLMQFTQAKEQEKI